MDVLDMQTEPVFKGKELTISQKALLIAALNYVAVHVNALTSCRWFSCDTGSARHNGGVLTICDVEATARSSLSEFRGQLTHRASAYMHSWDVHARFSVANHAIDLWLESVDGVTVRCGSCP